MCLFRFQARLNEAEQPGWVQGKPGASVCLLRMCRFRLAAFVNVAPQPSSSQTNGRLPKCTASLCIFKFSSRLNESPHVWHLKARSPKCTVLTCRFRADFCVRLLTFDVIADENFPFPCVETIEVFTHGVRAREHLVAGFVLATHSHWFLSSLSWRGLLLAALGNMGVVVIL